MTFDLNGHTVDLRHFCAKWYVDTKKKRKYTRGARKNFKRTI